MRGKILFATGLAVGYVLGARAGRQQYEKIKAAASNLWNDPRVQHQVDTVEGFVKDKAPEVADFVADNAKKVASQVTRKKNGTSPAAGSATAATSPDGATAT